MVKRLVSERTLLVASCATVLFATTMLAALAAYGTSVTGEGLRRTLAHPTFAQVGMRVTGEASDLRRADSELRASLRQAFGAVPLEVSGSARGDSYVVPGQEHLDHPQLTAFATYAGIEAHAKLTSGTWPRPARQSGPVEAVLPDAAAAAMHLRTGDTATLHSRIDGRSVQVKITGTFKVRDPNDYFWTGDRLAVDGVEKLGYTTFGPLVVPQDTFAGRIASTSLNVNWQVLPDTRGVTTDQLTGLAARVDAAGAALHSRSDYVVVTSLPALLNRLNSTVLVARSTMLIPLLQLVVLAGYALLLVARLIADHRRMEIALLRARGATGLQLARLTLSEGLLLALPAAVLAPLLAPLPLRLVAGIPSIEAAGLRLDTSPSAALWLASIGTAVACAVALTLPTLRGVAKSYVATQVGRGRGERRGPLQRAGADLALLVIAGVAMWQLGHYGGPIATSGSGLGGVDPLTVAGPTLALLAGGALVMRLIPMASRTGERLTGHGTGFAPAVATRQLSRRPLRYAGPALLLVMAVAVGVLSLSASATWRQSQTAQADFQSGADLRLTPGSLDLLGQGGRYAGLPGVTAVSPVYRGTAVMGGHDVTMLAGDSRTLDGMLSAPDRPLPASLVPSDLTSDLPSAVTAGARTGPTLITADRSGSAAMPVIVPTALPSAQSSTTLPGRPGRIDFEVRLSGGDGNPDVTRGSLLSVMIADGRGLAREVDLGGLAADGGTVTRTVSAAALAGPDGVLTYPLSVRGFHFQYTDLPGTTPLTLSVVSVKGDQGPGLAPPPAARWLLSAAAGLPTIPPPVLRQGTFLTVDTRHGFLGYPASVSLVAMIGSGDAPLPVVITSDLAQRAHLAVGGMLTITPFAQELQVRVAAIVGALPSTAPDQPAMLLDLGALTARTLDSGASPPAPTEWWLTASDGTGKALSALAAHRSWSAGFTDRASLREELRNSPLGAALPGALVLGFAAALAFAVIGFTVNAIVSARERRTEFVIMRALGASGRQLFGLLAIEQAILVLFGLLGGIGLGVALAQLVIPHIVLTVRAGTPYPPVELTVPWIWVAALTVGVSLLLFAILVVLGRGLRKGLEGGGSGSAARLGEDR